MSEQLVVEKDPKNGRFLPGNSGFGGRPKGARSKLGEAFIEKLQQDFNEHGVKAIEQVRLEKPDAYLKVIASILPKDLNVNVNHLETMTDEQLIARVQELQKALGPLLELSRTEYEERDGDTDTSIGS